MKNLNPFARYGKDNGFFKKKHSAETRAKMRRAWAMRRKERIASLKKDGARRAADPILKAKQAERNRQMAKDPKWRKSVKARFPYGVKPPKKKVGAKPKTIEQYEKEAKRLKSGCFIHPSHGAAAKIYRLRHGDYQPRGNSGGLRVCHTCDVPKCIADTHHFLGTQRDNVLDAVKKGRHSCFENIKRMRHLPHTAEAKAKISSAAKRMWARRRLLP